MVLMEDLQFSFSEILSLIGLVQCVYLMVYIGFRTEQIGMAGLPLLYFFVLGAAFFFDLAENHIGQISDYYYYLQWVAWFSGPPLSVLLVIQFSQIANGPSFKDYWVLLLVPLCFMLSVLAVGNSQACNNFDPCDELKSLMSVTGLLAGAISLLIIFSKKDLLLAARRQRFGSERYWLILALIFVNIFFLFTMFAQLTEFLNEQETILSRTILGLGFVYLVSTSLLRLYPQHKKSGVPGEAEDRLSQDDLGLAKKIESLMTHEKVYQEQNYSRSDLARECGAPETMVSRVVNIYFDKSYPQLVNELRVDDAKQLLEETDAPVKTIGEEVGFNSLPSFNRVFKEITGEAPSGYRNAHKKLLKT